MMIELPEHRQDFLDEAASTIADAAGGSPAVGKAVADFARLYAENFALRAIEHQRGIAESPEAEDARL